MRIYLCVQRNGSFYGGIFLRFHYGNKADGFYNHHFIALVVKYATLYIESINMTIFENLGHLTSSKAKKAAATYIICTVVGIAFYFVPSAPFDSIIKGLPGIIGNTLTVMGAGGLVNWYLRG